MSAEAPRLVAADLIERHRSYQAMVVRLRELVQRYVPQGATVAVVSKGDPDLVSFDGRQGWHFPQDINGGYAGYHPRDSAAAIHELEALRSRGADFLALPTTSSWWLDHYAGFGSHLRGYETVAEDAEAGTIFALQELAPASNAVSANDPMQDLELHKHVLLTAQITDLIDHLGPPEQAIVVLQPEGSIPFEIEHRPTRQLSLSEAVPHARSRSTGSLAAQLDSHWRQGATFLVVPRGAFEWWEQHPEFRLQVERKHRCITRQAHVCFIFELGPIGVARE